MWEPRNDELMGKASTVHPLVKTTLAVMQCGGEDTALHAVAPVRFEQQTSGVEFPAVKPTSPQ
jgi:hypothetical protein